MRSIELQLRGDHIALDALLKACGLAASGGAAKAMITAGEVTVDGQPELRRGRKLRAGAVVEAGGCRVRVEPAAATSPSSCPAPERRW